MGTLLTKSCGTRHALQQQLGTSLKREGELREELELTKGSYETQLTELSEHLAIMNDKIAEKQELINELQIKIKTRK